VIDRKFPQGLKPDVDLIGFIGMTEVMPCYKALEICARGSFLTACEAVLFQRLCYKWSSLEISGDSLERR
jgi:hypothetical protein